MAASTVHDFTGVSSSQTTQAPQLDVSQPQCEPVRSRSSRIRWMSSSLGSMTRAYCVPFTVRVICMSGPQSLGAAYGGAQRPHGQLAGQVPLVISRPALVGDRLAVLGGELAGPGEGLLGRGGAAQEILGLPRRKVPGAHRGQANPGVLDGGLAGGLIRVRVRVEPERRACRAARPVADLAADLLIGAAAAGRDRDLDLGEDL